MFLLLVFLNLNSMLLFDFSPQSDLNTWRVVDDGVMGGLSQGHFDLTPEGHARFHGDVSLDNNGGFSSVRYQFPREKVHQYSKAVLRLKGDGKKYQFRVKSSQGDAHSYKFEFQTSGKWETIEIALHDLQPTYRGYTPDLPNYPGETLEQIAFLIANKKAEHFQLEIDKISLK